MALCTSISASPFSVASPIGRCPLNTFKRFTQPIIASSLSSPSSAESKKSSAPSQTVVSSTDTSANAYPASSRPPEPSFNYALANGSLFARFAKSAVSSIERVSMYYTFSIGCWRFIGWFTIVLSQYICLAGTVMLIFGMGLSGLFISNVPNNVPSSADRALKGSSLFGMFALKTLLGTWQNLEVFVWKKWD